MTQERQSSEETEKGRDHTAPPDGQTHEATTPPGGGDRDEKAIADGEDRLEQAGGGH